MEEYEQITVTRPFKFAKPSDLAEKIQAYFDSITVERQLTERVPVEGETIIVAGNKVQKYETRPVLDASGEPVVRVEYIRPATVTGMCLFLGITRNTLKQYKKKDGFSDVIEMAKMRLENYLEEKLEGNCVTGIIFNLKNNYGWKDKVEQEITGKDGASLVPPVINFVSK